MNNIDKARLLLSNLTASNVTDYDLDMLRELLGGHEPTVVRGDYK